VVHFTLDRRPTRFQTPRPASLNANGIREKAHVDKHVTDKVLRTVESACRATGFESRILAFRVFALLMEQLDCPDEREWDALGKSAKDEWLSALDQLLGACEFLTASTGISPHEVTRLTDLLEAALCRKRDLVAEKGVIMQGLAVIEADIEQLGEDLQILRAAQQLGELCLRIGEEKPRMQARMEANERLASWAEKRVDELKAVHEDIEKLELKKEEIIRENLHLSDEFRSDIEEKTK
jgi:hypothetical protein